MVVSRITRIFSHIFIDEVQDLAGYDLEIIRLLFGSSATIVLAGDPRQVTYLTHHERFNSRYVNGMIERYLTEKCAKLVFTIDKDTLKQSHRNNQLICTFASKLYPSLPASNACSCDECRKEPTDHIGVFILRPTDVEEYKAMFSPAILHYKGAQEGEWNFGASKGMSFDRVLIYPTSTIVSYLFTGQLKKVVAGKEKDAFDIAKFYVAVTRARHSVAIVCSYPSDRKFIDGLQCFPSLL
jgi:DNA helicase-2/ATP-dependent DNA helicase PcrA